MKYLYYCNSTYQLLNVLNLHWQRSLYNYENISDYSADLILLNAYEEAREIKELIQDSKIFNSVKIVERVRVKGKMHIFKSIFNIVFPSFFLKKSYKFILDDIKDNYDVISTPKYNMLVLAIWQLNKQAKMQIHEDGIGTYILNFNDNLMSKTYRLIYSIFNYGRHLDEIDSIYVNKKELYLGNLPKIVKEIPVINDVIKKKYLSLFNKYAVPEKNEKNFYWLSQIVSEKNEDELIDNLQRNLLNIKESVVYCPHPRNKMENKYHFDESHRKQIWELKILNTDNMDSKVLISSHSTAMLTPFILYNIEPYLIFTYCLVENTIIPNKEKFEKIVSICKKNYSDKNKIMVPTTLEEYKNCIKLISANRI